jgi:hypothetical protein
MPLKVTAFNANGIGRQRHELSKQLQDLHIDVTLFSETRQNPMIGSIFKIAIFIESIAKPERKGRSTLASWKEAKVVA